MTDDFLLLTTGKAAEYPSCSRDELIARAWLPTTVEAARVRIGEWRSQDATAKSFKRRGLRSVG
jgi:hypothetical protein